MFNGWLRGQTNLSVKRSCKTYEIFFTFNHNYFYHTHIFSCKNDYVSAFISHGWNWPILYNISFDEKKECPSAIFFTVIY